MLIQKQNTMKKKNNTFILYLALLNLVFIVVVGFLIKILPFNSAPDEQTHFQYNVNFILENNRLPVSGKDDLTAYQNCRDNKFGEIPCIISYTVYPGLNYIVSVVIVKLIPDSIPITIEKQARFASLLWGLIYLNSLILGLKEILRNKNSFYAIVPIFSFIPQVLYISAYLNQDIHSLAISALLGYTVIKLFKRINYFNILIFSTAIGLLFSTKYNYFIYLPVICLFVGYMLYTRRLHKKQTLFLIFTTSLMSLMISGFWYIRNLILYHDPLGQSFMLNTMSQYHHLGSPLPINFNTFVLLTKLNFWNSSFNSFFALFGYMNLELPTAYLITKFTVILGIVIFVCLAFQLKNKKLNIIIFLTFTFCVSTLILHILNSIKYDMQPQGRYLFPIIIPIAYTLATASKKSNKFNSVIYLGLALIIYLFIVNYL